MRTWLAVGGVVMCVVLLATQITLPERNTDLAAFPRLTDARLADRTIVDFSAPQEGVVSYSYLGATVPEILADDEVPELRNETSYTRLVDVSGEGEEALLTLSTVIFSQPAYAQDADGSWRYLEYATTTEQAFRNRDTSLLQALREVFVRTAYADTVSPFSGAGDGLVSSISSETSSGCTVSANWSVARYAITGDIIDYTTNTASALSDTAYSNEIEPDPDFCSVTVNRIFLPFDSSSINSNATILSASLNIYVTSVLASGGVLAYVSTSSQTTHTSLATTDFDAAPQSVISSGNYVATSTLASLSANAYNTFPFYSLGISEIRKSGETSSCSATTGITCVSLREGSDVLSIQPADNSTIGLYISTSEFTGTSQDPYLSVTYTAPAASVAVRGSGKLLPGGAFRVLGGKLKIQ